MGHSNPAMQYTCYVLHELGIRGSDTDQQVKQGIVAAALELCDDYLLNEVTWSVIAAWRWSYKQQLHW